MASNFNWITPVYDTLARAVFGQSLNRAQSVFLDRIPAGASVLIVGGGTGWLLEPLLRGGRTSHILYLETSARMLARASQRVLDRQLLGVVAFQLGDERTLPTGMNVDVVITPFVLDMFTAQSLRTQMIPLLRQALKPGGQWIITDFVVGAGKWQKRLIQLMIWFFRLTASIETRQLVDWQSLMAETGLRLQERQPQVGGMVSAEIWVDPLVS
ncbi:class I SAM-dependent methyltransferase [Spirosoma utsteinense]|uniref:Ubiquinone/menaquinone biosynthesis C-methylase UbiE n=1 Tax=Spirosoma utsteinense TaxID=2585773 RepID=A0ABR6W0J5_9BACT|nr:class I SAM-dependent methyltransferase [Spirosoma utsteinense]MBC3784590.1 ubiquinone/menaquinone biosynthesis C-methylase UbiE [Spirosoma utsteinense]MBC3789658.1 ubiquinone/menaquinone biosynthesis C-methylase UbiE [Spirosoma utsteinense]